MGANYFSVGGRTFTVKKSPEGEIVMANIRPGGGIIPVFAGETFLGGDPIIVHLSLRASSSTKVDTLNI